MMRILDAAAVIEQRIKMGVFRPEISLRRGLLRAAEMELLTQDSSVPLLVLGVAGSGKTTWLCQLAEERGNGNQAVVYLDDLFETGGSFNETEVVDVLETLARRSLDKRVLAIADDAGGRPFHDLSLMRLLSLANATRNRSAIRVAIALRGELFAAFMDRNAKSLRREAFREVVLQPFAAHELTAIAKLLPPPEGCDSEFVREARAQAAQQLVRSTDPSSLVPALAVSFLETIETPSFLDGLSRYRLYSHLYYGRVLRSSDDTGAVRKSRLLKELAVTLADRSEDTLEIDVRQQSSLPFQAEDDYRELVAARMVEQRIDDYGVRVGFVDDDFLAFVAAIAIDGRTSDRLREYLTKGEQLPRARRVAAFFVARVISGAPAGAEQVFATLPKDDLGFLQLVGELDRNAFLSLLPLVAQDSALEAIRLVEDFQRAGFPHLAVDGARLLMDKVPVSERRRVRRLYGEALCKVDRLEEAQAVLREVESGGESDPQLLYVLGEIAVARHQLREAKRCYSRMLAGNDVTTGVRAKALHGLGDVEAWHEHYTDAAHTIKEAIRLYASLGDSSDLAEAWGDLSLVLVHMKKCKEARAAVANSRAINLRLSLSFPGLIIVEGLNGNVDLCEGNLDRAHKRLSKCLDDCRNYGLRWREAWCLGRLAELMEARRDHKQACELRAESERIFGEL